MSAASVATARKPNDDFAVRRRVVARAGASLEPGERGEGDKDVCTLHQVVCRYIPRGGRREEVYPRIRTLMKEFAPTVPPILRDRARIRHFTVFVTTTFDALFAQALDENGVQNALAADKLGCARVLLNRHRPEPGEVDLRCWEWRYLWRFCQSDAQSILKDDNEGQVLSVAVSGHAAVFLARALVGGNPPGGGGAPVGGERAARPTVGVAHRAVPVSPCGA